MGNGSDGHDSLCFGWVELPNGLLILALIGISLEMQELEISEDNAFAPFRRLHHVSVVVRDLKSAVTYYERLGIGPWYEYPKGAPYVELDVPNKEASASMRYMCCDLDNFQLQLCQPSELDSPQRRFLDERGEGVYHLGFESDLGRAEGFGREIGLNVIARGRREDNTGFCYFDTRKGAGTVLSVRHSLEVK